MTTGLSMRLALAAIVMALCAEAAAVESLRGARAIDATSAAPDATPIGQTHYEERDGGLEIPGARYSCNLCHVGQRTAAPLVENEFGSAGRGR